MRNRQILEQFCRVIENEFGPACATLVDVGAARGADARWEPFQRLLKTVGFEPGREEFEKLQNSETSIWLNVALSSKNETRTIHLTKYWSNTSLLAPNQALLKTLAWGDGHEVVREEPIKCVPLDEVLKMKNLGADFLKVDTQGTELEILRGAEESTVSLLTVEVEVEFCPLYEDQPLFADVDAWLRGKGFYLQDLGNTLFVKPRDYPASGGAKGRLVSADALYLRDPLRAPDIAGNFGLSKIPALLTGYLAYGYPELCLVAMDSLQKAGIASPWLADARRLCEKIRHLSKALPLLPGKTFAARLGRKFWQHLYDFHGSLWDSPLGNKLH